MNTQTSHFPALLVRKGEADSIVTAVEWLANDDLPTGEVLIEVVCSSLNYKDALAFMGNPGVVASFPHVPGIDCSGTVLESSSNQFAAGEPILVTGYKLGSGAWGGYSGRARVPADWVVALPQELSPDLAMTYGTAGFTAAQAVSALLRNGATPDRGPLLVTGATGGVGVFSVAILAKLGFEVVAMTGKSEFHDLLKELGASRCIGRDAFAEAGGRPLIKAEWSGGVDSVGGETLAALIRSTRHRGCVAACGLVGGADLPLSVYPFILRGVTLAGIDSAQCPHEPRLEIWRKLSGPWRVELPAEWVTSIDLDGLPARVAAMLGGKAMGRTLVRPTTRLAPPST